MASQTEENYLKSLLMLADQNEKVTVSELSKLLKVSLPTVNSMVKKLDKQGLIRYNKYKPVSLTAKGKKTSSLILRKHRLAEMFLVEKMGFGWEKVHEIAEQIEHISSEDFFRKMDELLGFPKIDPHGSPIPDTSGRILKQTFKSLSNYRQGDHLKLAALSNDTSDFLNVLNSRGLQLGTVIEIKHIEQFDRSMILSYKDHPLETLSKTICDNLLVEMLNS
jgi:DtxR family transcriptional regulator, Mn-dependent transcriptional regulator